MQHLALLYTPGTLQKPPIIELSPSNESPMTEYGSRRLSFCTLQWPHQRASNDDAFSCRRQSSPNSLKKNTNKVQSAHGWRSISRLMRRLTSMTWCCSSSLQMLLWIHYRIYERHADVILRIDAWIESSHSSVLKMRLWQNVLVFVMFFFFFKILFV